jgi:hypothetical protein
MEFPIPILRSLSTQYRLRWSQFYVGALDRKRTQEEGIWRRTQTKDNAEESNWTSPTDQRRRVVHYLHDFNLAKRGEQFDLEMIRSYVFYSLSLPREPMQL